MHRVAGIDFGEPLPELDEKFLRVWSTHYMKIAGIASVKSPLLEIGAGYGVLAAGLSLISGGRVWTTEHPSRSYLASASYRRFLDEFGIEMAAHDLTEGLPFKEKSFEQVYLCDVIEHFAPDVIPFIFREISRVLRPGGNVVISTPNLNRLSGLLRFLAGYSVNPPLEVRRAGDTFDHIRELAPKELLKLLTKQGFQTRRFEFAVNPYFTSEAYGEDNIFSPAAVKVINTLTGLAVRFVPRFGDEMYIVASKQSA